MDRDDLNDLTQQLLDAYRQLEITLAWDRDRALRLAQQIANQHGPETGRRWLAREIERVRQAAER